MRYLRLCGRELLDVFYPELCVACHRPLVGNEHTLCMFCLHDLPLMDCADTTDNAVARLFWGLVPVAHAAALFRYRRGSRYHALLHRLKYQGGTDIGRQLGRYLGSRLQHTPFAAADGLVPVPLHPSRLASRGYNQSRFVADGLSEALGLPVMEHALKRTRASVTQTHSGRRERFGHVEGIFAPADPAALAGRHIILVDDVITTGATLTACAEAALQVPGVTVSVAALAVAAE